MAKNSSLYSVQGGQTIFQKILNVEIKQEDVTDKYKVIRDEDQRTTAEEIENLIEREIRATEL